jgi:hypothetical protein
MLCNQQQALPRINFDFFGNTTTCDSKHGKLLPNSFRAIFCGKTNALLSLVFSLNGLRFENVCVF